MTTIFWRRSLVLASMLVAILGSVLAAWMLTVAGTAALLLPRGGTDAWLVLAVPVVVWFVLDTGFSLAIGSWPHAAFNVAFLAVLGTPLLGWRRAHRREQADRSQRARS